MEGPFGKTHACCKFAGATLVRTAEVGIADVTTSGAGVYLITLASGYAIDADDANHQATCIDGTPCIVSCVQLSSTAFGVTTVDADGAPIDCDVSFRVTREKVG